MITITTHQGKEVEIVLESELCSPVDMGERVRAYCHIHGSDHQRSLSINKATGWGHCFNAACGATVLVAEWNRALAKRLLQVHYRGLTSAARPDLRASIPGFALQAIYCAAHAAAAAQVDSAVAAG